jgi:hypothetical protein
MSEIIQPVHENHVNTPEEKTRQELLDRGAECTKVVYGKSFDIDDTLPPLAHSERTITGADGTVHGHLKEDLISVIGAGGTGDLFGVIRQESVGSGNVKYILTRYHGGDPTGPDNLGENNFIGELEIGAKRFLEVGRNFQDGLSDTTSGGQFGARLVEGEDGKLALVIGEGNNVNGDNGRYRYDSTNGTYVYMSGVNTKTAVYDGNNDGITEEHSQPETSEALGSNEASLPEHLIERATETGDWMVLAKADINPFSVDIGNTLNPVGRVAAGEEFKRRERARNRGENPDDPETGRTSAEKSTEWVLGRTVNRS